MATTGSFVQNLLTDVAKGFFGNDYVRDYTHAAKTFRSSSYQYAPKYKFLFHVYFDINPAAYAKNISTGANFGLAVKTVELPKYNIDTFTMNQYNRKRLIQTKIKYNPITITFHDDNGNLINDMWYNYYTYYFMDANKPVLNIAGRAPGGTSNNPSNSGSNYNTRNLYNGSLTGDNDWGFIGEANQQSGTVANTTAGISKIPFFKNIQIFGFNQHNFIRYTLINPVITSFNHDTYDYSQGNGTMSNTMTIDYETVKYAEGALDGKDPSNIVTGFGLRTNYDTTVSPIATPGSNSTIIGPGGLLDAAGGVVNDLSNGNILGAIRTAGVTYNTFKNTNLKQVATSDLNNVLRNATQQQLPSSVRRNTYYPVYGTSPNVASSAGAPGAGSVAPEVIDRYGTGYPASIPQPAGLQTNINGTGVTGFGSSI